MEILKGVRTLIGEEIPFLDRWLEEKAAKACMGAFVLIAQATGNFQVATPKAIRYNVRVCGQFKSIFYFQAS